MENFLSIVAMFIFIPIALQIVFFLISILVVVLIGELISLKSRSKGDS